MPDLKPHIVFSLLEFLGGCESWPFDATAMYAVLVAGPLRPTLETSAPEADQKSLRFVAVRQVPLGSG